ncbi:hypothetical protein BCF44_108330 [Kutzneria buriramensis]|uniref:Uncharacterized protein n=2 Tax=Kutzneria buriramensis TaxID=1045776 RepID=A0A3E0HGI8_9PSEU|nr:hypothetical protein BCF44_108330 [Kutzneria buriramensis]
MTVFAIIDWAVRIVVLGQAIRWYGSLAGLGTGVVLLLASESCWRLISGEWGNLWPTRMVIALVARRRGRRSAG